MIIGVSTCEFMFRKCISGYGVVFGVCAVTLALWTGIALGGEGRGFCLRVCGEYIALRTHIFCFSRIPIYYQCRGLFITLPQDERPEGVLTSIKIFTRPRFALLLFSGAASVSQYFAASWR